MHKKIFTLCFISLFTFQINHAQESIAREWNELLLQAIRGDFARPTVHARNLFHTSAAMYDAWAVYDTTARPWLLGDTVNGFVCPLDSFPMPTDIEAARHRAISYAAYRMLRHRFDGSPGENALFTDIDFFMATQGYDWDSTSTDYTTGSAAAMGNYIANCMIDFGMEDGANEAGSYENLYYEPVNDPLIMDLPGNPDISDFNRWQPLTLDVFIDQGGNPIPLNTPEFLSPEWGIVTPFSLQPEDLDIYQRDGDNYWVYHDPGPPPYLNTQDTGGLSEEYKWGFELVSVWSAHLDANDTTMWDISPASIGNIQKYPDSIPELRDFYDLIEGGDPSPGHAVNPITGQPYDPQIVPRGDYGRVLAEFWADGPDSETPPGHWFTILNYVNDHPDFEKRYRGQGVVMDDLEWDVKAYLMLGGAMHDVAISAWGVKGWYDYVRPVSAIRGMAELGQSSDPNLPSYHPGGLHLIPGYIELVEPGDPLAPGGNVGKIKLKAWRGPDYIPNPANTEAGVDWILAEEWWPYQRPSFVTPPFAGYVSGHSTYSRAAAEVLTLLTGDEYFPGGMGEFFCPANEFLVFEDGPSVDITLQWATYRDASDQCSLSRIWGGIHPPADDIPGRLMGIEIGVDAFYFAEQYFFRDDDGDGFLSFYDCNDNDPTIYPGASEICNGLDNDCDGMPDDSLQLYTYFWDFDQDDFGRSDSLIVTCLDTVPMGYSTNDQDCDDTNPDVNPAMSETCDGIDNNCDGQINEDLEVFTYYRDMDNDSFGNEAIFIDTCLVVPPIGYVTNALDCNDADSLVHPNVLETCDGIDNNCDGQINEDLEVFTYYRDMDNDLFGNPDSLIDTCLIMPPVGFVTNALDCDDTNALINPDATEVCDSIDNNCSGMVDDGLATFVYYQDNDEDGFGNPDSVLEICDAVAPPFYVANLQDCNDEDPMINPTAEEVLDSIDNNCNGEIDEGLSSVKNIAQEKLQLFPNPVTNMLTVKMEGESMMKYRIIHLNGVVMEFGVLDFTNQEARLDFGTYPKGVYLIELENREGELRFLRKIVRI